MPSKGVRSLGLICFFSFFSEQAKNNNKESVSKALKHYL